MQENNIEIRPNNKDKKDPFLASQDAQEVMLVTLSVSESALADFTDVTLVSEDAAHNTLQMSSSIDLIDVIEDARHNFLKMSSSSDLTDVSEDAAHNSLQCHLLET